MDNTETIDGTSAQAPVPRARISPVIVVALVVGLAGLGWRAYHEIAKPDFANYKVNFPGPAPWQNVPHSPGALWVYRNPQTQSMVRGATQQMVFEFNPTPNQNSGKLANDMVAATRQNQREWTAKRLEDVPAKGVTFCIVRRDKKGQCVVTGVLVKGNTTLLVALSARDAAAKNVQNELPYFYGMLKQISLSPTTIP